MSVEPPADASDGRRLMRQIREIMAARAGAQERLDRFVGVIASGMGADVCSVYLRRSAGQLELCATFGLAADAVHQLYLSPGEGLVGAVARSLAPVNVDDAPNHPAFSYQPEVGEEGVVSFLGAPILRGGRLLGVLTVQGRVQRAYGDEEVETLQTAAMVLAEVVADPAIAGEQTLEGLDLRPSRAERLVGRRIADGVVVGTAVKHEPHVPSARLIADDPAAEAERVERAVHRLREAVDALLTGRVARLDEPREVLEAYRMIAHDQGWLERLRDAAGSGLTAEAAVERVRSEHRARMLQSRDPYLRARLHDLEDLANRLLRHLSEEDGADAFMPELPENAVLVARDIGPAELLEHDAARLRAVLLEEGAPNSHAAIVARALGVPMVGRLEGVLDRVEDGDLVVVDGARAEVHLRPKPEVVSSFEAKIALTGEQRAEFERLRDRPAVSQDGVRVSLLLNAGLSVDLPQIARTGADGVGLFRTEFQFMVSDSMPRLSEQAALYRAAVEAAGPDRPVVFRTLDLGGDKILPYVSLDAEENPAMGWRALRLALDRPGLMRYQLRALTEACAGRALHVMFPLISTVDEFRAAKALVDAETTWAARRGRPRPAQVRVGAMLETPALAFQLDALLAEADFISIGANDLLQFFFAADRSHPKLADRYDILSPPALRFLAQISDSCLRAGVPATVCGESAGRPLDALALIALGFTRLSMPPSGVGPVKRAILSANVGMLRDRLFALIAQPDADVRPAFEALVEQAMAPA